MQPFKNSKPQIFNMKNLVTIEFIRKKGCHSFKKGISLIWLFFGLMFGALNAQVNLEITEIFPGQAGDDLTADWFEVKNTGNVAWVSGVDPVLYYDDESQDPNTADPIDGIASIDPGAYAIVLITDNPVDVSTFNAVWGEVIDLEGIEIGFCDGAGLGGGGDAVTLWIGDPLTEPIAATGAYPDTDANDGQTYDLEIGAFSEVANANQAVATNQTGGSTGDVPNVGSPGNQGPVVIDPNDPYIVLDSLNVSPFLMLSTDGPSQVGSDLSDTSDPLQTFGIPFIVGDADNPVELLFVALSSSNEMVVAQTDMVLSGTAPNYLLEISPSGVGYTDIQLTVEDPDLNTGNYIINLAVSNAALDSVNTRFYYGSSDGSTAITTGGDHLWVGDDENQTLRLFQMNQSTTPLKAIDFNDDLGSTAEIDIEGSIRYGNELYWMGSLASAERSVVFKATETGMGAEADLLYGGVYRDLRSDLLAWDANGDHGLGNDFFGLSLGFEVEGLAADPNNPDGAILGFRSTLTDNKALLVKVDNFKTIVAPEPNSNSAVIGDYMLMDLQGRSIRSLECNAFGCLVIAGPSGTTNGFKLHTWTGNFEDQPELRAADLSSLENLSSFEGIVGLPNFDFTSDAGDTAHVGLLVDTGTFDYYGDGTEAKDLPHVEWKKCRSEKVVLGAVETPPVANPGDVIVHEIMQNPSVVSDSEGEWFEVYNTSIAEIDMNGWIIKDNDSDEHIIDNGQPLIIAPGDYLILGINADTLVNGGVAVDYQYTNIALANGADEIILISTDSVEINRVEYDGGTEFPDPNGASMSLITPQMDNAVGANWCVATTAFGSGDFGTPGMANDCPPPAIPELKVTEIWVGQDGADLTADWFEITNLGEMAWVDSLDGMLYYDDESQDPAVADPIVGFSNIQPGESVIVVVDNETAPGVFFTVWSPDYDLETVKIGYTDGAGLGQGGDAVTLFLGGPSAETIIDYQVVPASPSGVSYDVILNDFSQEGVGSEQPGTNVAVATTATAGASGTEPAIGSPGNKGPVNVIAAELKITEIFPGQAGTDITADWFEITNVGNAPWMSDIDPVLFYDDESASAADADTIFDVEMIMPGKRAIVVIGNQSDIEDFETVWSLVIDLTDVEIGYTDGSGLGGGRCSDPLGWRSKCK
jgi:hypothetical protein